MLSFGSGVRVQGSGFKVQGSRFKVQVAASPPFFEDGILVSSAFPSRGRCPVGADRAQALERQMRKAEQRGTYGERVSPLAKISHFARNDDTGV